MQKESRGWPRLSSIGIPAGLAVISLVAIPSAWGEPPPEAPDEASEPVDEASNPFDSLPWIKEGTGELGDKAELKIPAGFRFGATDTAVTLLRVMGNIPDGSELGLVGPDDLDWFVVYDFEEVGYVKDDDKDDLDATKMLRSIRDGTKGSNEVRKSRGLPEVEVIGWAIPPRYNPDTQVLEWATRLRFKDPDDGSSSESINYRTKVLGRKGVMNVIVVCGADELEQVLPAYQEMMKGFSFVEGERYAEFRSGDRVAEYGLAALVVGAGTAVAAKAGLFALLFGFIKKGGKLIILGVVAVGAALARVFGGLFRRR